MNSSRNARKNLQFISYGIREKQKRDFFEPKKLTKILCNFRDDRQLFVWGKVLIFEGGKSCC